MSSRCCWRAFKITTAAKIMSSAQLASYLAVIVVTCVAPGTIPFSFISSPLLILTIVETVICAVATLLVFIGCRIQRADLIIYIMGSSVCSIISRASDLFNSFFRYFLSEPEPGDTQCWYGDALCINAMIQSVIGFLVTVWFFTIFNECYEHLRRIERPNEYIDPTANCCGITSPMAGAQTIAVVNIECAVKAISILFIPPEYAWHGIGMTMLSGFDISCAFLVLCACAMRCAELMKPMVVYSVVRLFFIGISLVLCFYGLIVHDSTVPNWFRFLIKEKHKNDTSLWFESEEIIDEKDVELNVIFFTISSLVTLIIASGYFFVFNKGFKYIRQWESPPSSLHERLIID